MHLSRESLFECSFDELKDEIVKFEFFKTISFPLLTFGFDKIENPELWSDGPQTLKLKLFGLIPLGMQTVVPQKILSSSDCFQIADQGNGSLFKEWKHIITLKNITETRVIYKDQIDFESNFSNQGSSLFLWFLLVFRHWRLKKLIVAKLAKEDRLIH